MSTVGWIGIGVAVVVVLANAAFLGAGLSKSIRAERDEEARWRR